MTITLTRDEAQQVLDALDEYRDSTEDFRVANRCISLIKTLRARLAQPEPDFDWKDMYEKEKRRREMWTAKYEKDIRKLERAVPTAQPEPEPVAWTVGGLITDFSRDFSAYKTKTYTQPLYTTPPQRKPEPEPVAWMLTELDGTPLIDCGDLVVKPRPVLVGDKTDCIPLYTAPPQREWVGLTDDKYEAMAEQYVTNCYFDTLKYAKAIEAKLKEKNT